MSETYSLPNINLVAVDGHTLRTLRTLYGLSQTRFAALVREQSDLPLTGLQVTLSYAEQFNNGLHPADRKRMGRSVEVAIEQAVQQLIDSDPEPARAKVAAVLLNALQVSANDDIEYQLHAMLEATHVAIGERISELEAQLEQLKETAANMPKPQPVTSSSSSSFEAARKAADRLLARGKDA